MFNISILLIPLWGKQSWQRSYSKINTGLTAIWSTALKILKWQIPPTAWALSPSKHSSSRLQQSVSSTAEQRSQTKLGRLDQTNDGVCGAVACLFKQWGDWLCTLLFMAAFIWGRNRLCEGQEAQSSAGSRVCEPVKAVFHHTPPWMARSCAQGYDYPPWLTCPHWNIIPMRAAINHFYCYGNIYCDCLPFYWKKSLS